MRCVLAGLWLGVMAGAASAAQAADPPPVVYACSDGSTLRVTFVEGAAQVTPADGTLLRLPQQRVASGMWYATARHELRGKGDEATWTVARQAPVNCRVKR